jgi:Tlde1 domain
VLGCAWTVYANVFASGPYPQLDSSSFDAHVASPPASFAARIAPVTSQIARLETPPVTSAPATPATVPAEPSLSFSDRFAASSAQGVAPAPLPETPKLAEAPTAPVETARQAEAPKSKGSARVRLAAVAPTSSSEPAPPRTAADSIRDMAQRAKAAVMSIASNERHTIVEKLWGKQPSHGPLLAYASADASATGSIASSQNPALGGSPPYDQSTAVYDISAHMVYLPDGTRLEAHSGLGPKLDDPSSANIRMHGVTPPHIYELKPREALFHGVAALRLTPIGGEEAIFGRAGLLAHSYMLGPNGDSNGCVSFKDYNAFLGAYHNQGIRKLAVVARID